MGKKKSWSVGQRIMERNLAKYEQHSVLSHILHKIHIILTYFYTYQARHNFNFHILIIFPKKRGGTLMGGEKER